MDQLKFTFVEEIDQELVDQKEKEHQRMKIANAASHLKSCMEYYPPDAEECEIMMMGIRLCRFVNDIECTEHCNLGSNDHTLGWMFPTKICLKDYLVFCKKNGLKAPELFRC